MPVRPDQGGFRKIAIEKIRRKAAERWAFKNNSYKLQKILYKFSYICYIESVLREEHVGERIKGIND